MIKNLIKTREFINKSIGEWRSIRSTHTLAFQEYENTTSNILIDYLDIDATANLSKNDKDFAVTLIQETKAYFDLILDLLK